MSFVSIPRGILRDEDSEFHRKFMIDTLFDYKNFLDKADASGAIGKGPESVKKVAVIGAGAAGLVAAYELSRVENLEVTVYEASNRIGGRMDSIVIKDTPYNPKVLEMGCMRFPPTSYTLKHYLDKFGLQPAGEFPDPGKVDTKLYYENQLMDWKKGDKTPDNRDFQRIGDDFSKIIEYLLGTPPVEDWDREMSFFRREGTEKPKKLFDYWDQYNKNQTAANKQLLIDSWQQLIDKYKDTTYYKAIYDLTRSDSPVDIEREWSEDDMNKFGALGVGSGGFGPLFEVNFVEILRLFANGWEDNQQFLEQGIVSVVKAFYNAIITQGGNFILQTKVKQVSKQDGQYVLNLSTEESATYDAVIIATTTRSMEYMGLTLQGNDSTPAEEMVSQSTKVALRNLHLMNSSKLFVTTKSKFWYAENNLQKIDLPANMQTDELMRGLYCLDYDMDGNNPEKSTEQGKGVVLISYVWGDDSSKLLALSQEERYQLFLEGIRKINPYFAQLLDQEREEMHFIDWENTPNYYGAFKLNYPGQEQANHDAFFQFQNQEQGVFLAGDSVSFAGGWLEGAMPTGVNAACAAAAYVGAQLQADSPLDAISADMYKYSRDEKVDKDTEEMTAR